MHRHLGRVFAAACAVTALPAFVHAQQATTISGTVTSDAGQPLPAASVMVTLCAR